MQDTDHISDQDLERHRRMTAHLHEAQRLAQQAQQFQQRSNELVAAFKIWAEELHERYEIPDGEGSGIDEGGAITRLQSIKAKLSPPDA